MSDVDHLDPVAPQRNSMEIFILCAAILSGTDDIVSLRQLSVEALIGPTWFYAWSAGLIVGGLVTLTGLFWPGRSVTALSLQQIGYAAFGFMALARAVALLGVAEYGEAFIVGAFAAAAIIRIWQVETRLRPFYPTDLTRWRRKRNGG